MKCTFYCLNYQVNTQKQCSYCTQYCQSIRYIKDKMPKTYANCPYYKVLKKIELDI